MSDPIDFNSLRTIEDCDALIEELLETIASIKGQIRHAQADLADGEEVDKHWIVRCQTAKFHIGQDLGKVQRIRSRLRKDQEGDVWRAKSGEVHQQTLAVQARNAEMKRDRTMSRDRNLLDFIKLHEPEAFHRALDRWVYVSDEEKYGEARR